MILIIVGIVVKSSAILCLTFTASLIAQRQSAALRHWIWTAGLLSALTLPLLGMILPAWRPGVPQISINTAASASGHETNSSAAFVAANRTLPFEFRIVRDHRPQPLTVLAIWSIGAALIAGLLFIEILKLMRLALRSGPVRHRTWLTLADNIRHAFQLRRPVKLLWNSKSSILGTWGTIRPRILLPSQSENWPVERMRAVLAHELSHVKRNDWLIQAVAESARVIYWFNPLFWLACSRLRRESEFACDDAVLRLGIDGPSYAEHVLDLVRTLNHTRRPGVAALAMAGTSNLERRMLAMLNPSINRRKVGKGIVAGIIFASFALTLPIAAMQYGNAEPVVAKAVKMEAAERTASSVAVFSPFSSETKLKSGAREALASPPPEASTAVKTAQIGIVPLTEGIITGTVSDAKGGVLYHATITIRDLKSGFTRTVLTNGLGKFTVDQLPPGDYTMTTSLQDFDTAIKEHIEVVAGQQTEVSSRLRLGVIVSTSVDISAQASFRTGPRRAATTVSEPLQYSARSETTISARLPIRSATVTPSANATRVPIRIGGDVQVGGLTTSAPKPVYPATAFQLGLEGTVVLSASVGIDGHIREIRVVSSTDPVFSDSALSAVQNWIYRPTLVDGVPVETLTSITANFNLTN